MDASLSLVRGADALGSVTIVALDATGRRAALDAARAGDTRFRAMADAAPVLVWLAAPDARRTWFNSQWLAFVGRRLEGEIGAGWLEHVHPDDRARCNEAATRDFAARRRSRLEYRLRRHDGIDRWVHDDGVPLFTGDGTFTGYVGACVDVTGQKLAELERRDLLDRERTARREAEAANQAKDEFLAALSHELRTPLHALRLWAGILRSGLHDPQALARAADTIDRNAVLQSRLIDDLLDVSRIVSGQLRLEIERVALGPIVQAAVETVRPAALNKGVRARRGSRARVGRGAGRRHAPAAGGVESPGQRGTLHARGRAGRGTAPAVAGEAELTVTDSGRGIAAALAAPRLRSLPPGRERDQPLSRRARPRALPRPPARRAARGHDRGRELRGGPGAPPSRCACPSRAPRPTPAAASTTPAGTKGSGRAPSSACACWWWTTMPRPAR